MEDRIKNWLDRNSFESEDFSNIDELVELKVKQNIKISLALPTVNEEKTVENVIMSIKNELYDKHKLLDEIIIVDTASTDNTVEIAKRCNIKVFDSGDIFPSSGSLKGETPVFL